jgi:hypothetical protein
LGFDEKNGRRENLSWRLGLTARCETPQAAQEAQTMQTLGEACFRPYPALGRQVLPRLPMARAVLG